MPNTLKFQDRFESTTPHLRNDVKKLQAALKAAGFDIEPDGFFGRKTDEYVKAFQPHHGLNVNGVVDAATWELLKAQQA